MRTNDDCAPDFVCGPVDGVKECVSSTNPDAGRDAGADAGADAGRDAGIDLDRDGYPLPGDCDDTEPAIHPDAIESCTNGRDDDCDTLTDCEASECAGGACAGGGTCLSFTCIASTEVLCNDGLDNDSDGRIDCADSECGVGTACTDSNGCTLGDRCSSDGGCEKAADLACTTPPGTCFSAAGVCQPDAGASCLYAPRTGSCNDGLACTTADTCTAGACGGTAVSCTTPGNSCFAAAGTCQEPSGHLSVHAAHRRLLQRWSELQRQRRLRR